MYVQLRGNVSWCMGIFNKLQKYGQEYICDVLGWFVIFCKWHYVINLSQKITEQTR